MGDNKRLRKQIVTLEARIDEHKDKIRGELDKPRPVWWWIHDWADECETWEREVDKKRSKLP